MHLWYTRIAQLSGYTLALVSTGALVLMMSSLPMSDTERCMAISSGIALQLCMYTFSKVPQAVYQFMALVLLVISVAATTAFLERSWKTHVNNMERQNATVLTESYRAKSLQRSIAIIDQEIVVRLTAAQRDTSGEYGNYRGRGLAQADSIDELKKERVDLLQEWEQLQQTDARGMGADQGSLQALLAGTNRLVRLAVFGLLALLVDVSALLAIGVQQPVAPRQEDQEVLRLQKSPAPINTCPVSSLCERVLSGDFGSSPSQRRAFAEITQAFDRLLENGLLIKIGRRYELVNKGV